MHVISTWECCEILNKYIENIQHTYYFEQLLAIFSSVFVCFLQKIKNLSLAFSRPQFPLMLNISWRALAKKVIFINFWIANVLKSAKNSFQVLNLNGTLVIDPSYNSIHARRRLRGNVYQTYLLRLMASLFYSVGIRTFILQIRNKMKIKIKWYLITSCITIVI